MNAVKMISQQTGLQGEGDTAQSYRYRDTQRAGSPESCRHYTFLNNPVKGDPPY